MKINQLKAGVIISYATEAVQVLTGLLYTPVMLRLLGQSEYGLYQLVNSVVSYLSLFSLGFGACYMRFYSRCKVNEDNEGIARFNGMFMTIFLVIAAICILCGGAMVLNAKAIFGNGLTDAELGKARILMAILVFNLAISFVDSVFKSNITAHERFFFQRIINLLKAIFSPFITLPLLIMGYGSVAMVVVTTVLTISIFLMDVWYCFKKLSIKFNFKHFNFGLLKEMWIFTFFIFLNMIVDRINWSIDSFLLGRMIGTTAVAVYGVAGQINTLYITFSTSVSSVFIPRVNMLVAKEQSDKKLTELFTKVGRVQFIILGLALFGYIIFGRDFIAIWAGDGYRESYRIGLFLLIPVTIPLIQNLGIEIQRAKNMHKARSYIYLFTAVSNIFVSIPCIKVWGTSGAAVGTAISLIIGNGLFMNLYYHFKIKLNIGYFWKEVLKLFPAIVSAVVIGLLIHKFIPADKVLGLALGIVLYTAVYCTSMWFLGMNELEKDLILKPIKAIGAKLCKK